MVNVYPWPGSERAGPMRWPVSFAAAQAAGLAQLDPPPRRRSTIVVARWKLRARLYRDDTDTSVRATVSAAVRLAELAAGAPGLRHDYTRADLVDEIARSARRRAHADGSVPIRLTAEEVEQIVAPYVDTALAFVTGNHAELEPAALATLTDRARRFCQTGDPIAEVAEQMFDWAVGRAVEAAGGLCLGGFGCPPPWPEVDDQLHISGRGFNPHLDHAFGGAPDSLAKFDLTDIWTGTGSEESS